MPLVINIKLNIKHSSWQNEGREIALKYAFVQSGLVTSNVQTSCFHMAKILTQTLREKWELKADLQGNLSGMESVKILLFLFYLTSRHLFIITFVALLQSQPNVQVMPRQWTVKHPFLIKITTSTQFPCRNVYSSLITSLLSSAEFECVTFNQFDALHPSE